MKKKNIKSRRLRQLVRKLEQRGVNVVSVEESRVEFEKNGKPFVYYPRLGFYLGSGIAKKKWIERLIKYLQDD